MVLSSERCKAGNSLTPQQSSVMAREMLGKSKSESARESVQCVFACVRESVPECVRESVQYVCVRVYASVCVSVYMRLYSSESVGECVNWMSL